MLSLTYQNNLPGRVNQHKKQTPNKMLFEILEIAINNPQGFTLSLPSLEPITDGIIVSYIETQDSFGIEGLKRAVEHAMAHDQVIGGWQFEGKFYFDSNKVFTNLDEAMEFGRSQKQIAIFDLTEQRLIKL